MNPSAPDQMLAEEAQALLDATAEVGGERVARARQRLGSVLEKAKETCDHFREKTMEGARAADQSVREHPYTAIGMALGLGAVVGFLLTRRPSD